MASHSLVKNGDCSENHHSEILSPLLDSSHGPFDKFGEPEILPRIALEYQAQIPPLVRHSKYLSHSRTIQDSKSKARLVQDSLIGLPLPLTSICIMGQELLRSCNRPSFDSRNLTKESKGLSTSVKNDESGHVLVPGLPNQDWTKSERDSFLLGLYVFEKNFVQIRLLVETKEMGSILSFYYSELYGTQEYRRWSESRKRRSKKCVYGQRLFSGRRQQELLSRILPMVSEECRNVLLEVSKAFRDEKTSLSDYVFTLKSMVGMEILVKAIGIGTGKQDLTGTTIESSGPGQVGPIRPETIPSGKACSSLTTAEIIKFISGGFRLSKARSNDLFWEAVWPRLLARGWHSEQPRGRGYSYNISSSGHCLVFLVPGVKKFSRRKLAKGDHYFDSVSDVLSRVAKDPQLIELDDETKEESDRTSETGSDSNQCTGKKRSYLQPRTPQRVGDGGSKFTIVDTALSGGEVIELRGLPCEASLSFTAQRLIDYRDKEESEKIVRETFGQDVSTAHSEVMATVISDSKITKKKKNNRKNDPKPLSSQKLKRAGVDRVASIKKRRKTLTARKKDAETTAGVSRNIWASSDDSHEKNALMQTLIDLNNFPQCPKEPDNASSSTEPSNDQVSESSRQATSLTVKVTTSELLSDLNPRRHGTRKRPPTAKALEALADGYLTTNKKRKVNETRGAKAHRSARAGVAPDEPRRSIAARRAVENEKGCAIGYGLKKSRASSRQCIGDISSVH